MLRTKSVDIGKYVAEITKVVEENVGKEKNKPAVIVYFKPKDKAGTVYSEKPLYIFSNFDAYEKSASYKFMDSLGELNENDIDCGRIQEKAQDKKFVITIGEENGYKNIVDVRLRKKKAQTAPGAKAKP